MCLFSALKLVSNLTAEPANGVHYTRCCLEMREGTTVSPTKIMNEKQDVDW